MAECHEYLGIEIGRGADQQKIAAAKLYTKANILLHQNCELKKCSVAVKNVAIYTYGNVYSIENMLFVGPMLRQAHRYLTKSVHSDWACYADLPGPNIRSRILYTAYGIHSLEVIHRKRRNNFLIKAALHENSIISGVIGSLDRITI